MSAGGRGCADVRPLLDELEEGGLDEARARAVRGHLVGCPACRAIHEANLRLTAALADLPPVDPPDAMLGRVFARVAAEEAADAHRPRLWWWWRAWRGRVATGSALAGALAIALAFVGWRRSDAPPPVAAPPARPDLYATALAEVARAEDEYRRALADLEAIVAEERPRWREDVARAYDANLAAIDDALARQRDVARAAPLDFAAQGALQAAYRQRLDFMMEAVLRGETAP